MKVSFTLCILLAFIDAGSSLQCEVCHEIGESCSGPMETCDPGKDTCGIVKHEAVQESKRIVITQKSCLHSNSCRTDPISVNFGNGRTQRSGITCCVGEACKTASDPLPPMNTVPNGLQCPACYTENSYQCSEDIVRCTGAQTQCLDMAGKITIGILPLKTARKGCTTESECTAPKGEKGFNVDLVRFECKPASSRGHKALGFAPRIAALLLPPLSRLILVQLLS
ncbi:phospholipase A2 inhibitor NAI-like [Gopherus flavomarginatus]|uniref:phospholipase A2 inhibitor NAI-like n=1 Tax=Gopherus flavomarginatus TaxID=286002 RepID=UPI0021CBC087|nr:phospholipase A2 inhibitor NAI-like [Gopherus flavomarginatus]